MQFSTFSLPDIANFVAVLDNHPMGAFFFVVLIAVVGRLFYRP